MTVYIHVCTPVCICQQVPGYWWRYTFMYICICVCTLSPNSRMYISCVCVSASLYVWMYIKMWLCIMYSICTHTFIPQHVCCLRFLTCNSSALEGHTYTYIAHISTLTDTRSSVFQCMHNFRHLCSQRKTVCAQAWSCLLPSWQCTQTILYSKGWWRRISSQLNATSPSALAENVDVATSLCWLCILFKAQYLAKKSSINSL